MNSLTWAASIAASLMTIGTLVRYLIRRTIRAAVWAAAAVRLPETVDRLAATVDTLTTSVERLAAAVDRQPDPHLESL